MGVKSANFLLGVLGEQANELKRLILWIWVREAMMSRRGWKDMQILFGRLEGMANLKTLCIELASEIASRAGHPVKSERGEGKRKRRVEFWRRVGVLRKRGVQIVAKV